MKKIAFTICAKNYLGLAKVLQKSIESLGEDILFFTFIADEISSEDKIELSNDVLVAREVLEIPEKRWYEMAFKYDLTEFCTSIKPSCFKYLFQKFDDSKIIYLDPDIFIYSSLENIYQQLKYHSIVLTPHIISIEDEYTGTLNEQKLLYSGMFNLGFIALKNDAIANKMISWWEIRLRDRCYQNMMENYFTDQKWIDFLPSFFPSNLFISHHLGLNVAPWNFHEREIVELENKFYVKNRIDGTERLYELVFIHFSGFDYKELSKNKLLQNNIRDLKVPVDFIQVFSKYAEALKSSEFQRHLQLSYSYNYFSNNKSIASVHRKFFRRLVEDERVNYNPFNSSSSFYHALEQNGLLRADMISNQKKNIDNITDVEAKTIKINRFFNLVYWIIGAPRFFLLVRLMRLYSKPENHIYLIDKAYFSRFKIWK